MQPTLTRPFYKRSEKTTLRIYSTVTYELGVRTANSLLGTVGTAANTNDGDGGAVSSQERANDGDRSSDTQETAEVVRTGCVSLLAQGTSVSNYVRNEQRPGSPR